MGVFRLAVSSVRISPTVHLAYPRLPIPLCEFKLSERYNQLNPSPGSSHIKETGYLPASNGNGRGQGNGRNSTGGTGHSQGSHNGAWNCSPKQKDLIQKIVGENNLDKNEVEALAQDRFGKGVKALSKLEASGLIEELLEKTGQNQGNARNRFQRRFQRAGGR